MASAGNNTFIEYITTPQDHFYVGPINNVVVTAANVLVYNPLNNEISYTLIQNTPLPVLTLQEVTTVGASTTQTCDFTHPTTAFTTTSNILIGGNITCQNINTQLFTLGTNSPQSFQCFNSQWSNYNITLCLNAAAQTNIEVHIGNNGIATTTVWNYNYSNIFGSLGGTVPVLKAGRINGQPLYIGGTTEYNILNEVFEFTIYNPMISKSTGIKSNNQYYDNNDGGNLIINGYLDAGGTDTFNTLFLYFSTIIDAGATLSVRGFN